SRFSRNSLQQWLEGPIPYQHDQSRPEVASRRDPSHIIIGVLHGTFPQIVRMLTISAGYGPSVKTK
ncbi:MAG TPA: hypothetical protein VIJ87_05975, partial [Pyrinomonadaceae bacterium]